MPKGQRGDVGPDFVASETVLGEAGRVNNESTDVFRYAAGRAGTSGTSALVPMDDGCPVVFVGDDAPKMSITLCLPPPPFLVFLPVPKTLERLATENRFCSVLVVAGGGSTGLREDRVSGFLSEIVADRVR